MQHEYTATLTGGVFVPEQPVALPEGSRVQLTVADVQPPGVNPYARTVEELVDSPLVKDVLAVTQRIFGSRVEIKWSADPEYPAERTAAFVVHTREAGEALRAKERQWIHETQGTARVWPSFSLLIRVD